MKVRTILLISATALTLSGCVIETRPGQSAQSAPNAPPPPPPPPPPGAPPPGAPPPAAPEPPANATQVPAAAPLPPPSGQRFGRLKRILIGRRDPAEPAPTTAPLPPQPPPKPTPAAPARVVPTLTEDVTGAPQISEGVGRSYWIWRTPDGMWKLRATSGSQLQEFHGWIQIMKDQLSQLTVTRMELERRVDVGGQVITFDFATKGGAEGVDFLTETRNSCIYFRLYAVDPPDRLNDPANIFIGPRAVKVTTPYFYLCPKK